MKITNLRTEVVHLPFASAIKQEGLGELRSVDCVLVFLETDVGLIGEGLVYSINEQRLTAPRAIRLGRALEQFDLAWLEEPVRYYDHAAEAAVAAALDMPIASGE